MVANYERYFKEFEKQYSYFLDTYSNSLITKSDLINSGVLNSDINKLFDSQISLLDSALRHFNKYLVIFKTEIKLSNSRGSSHENFQKIMLHNSKSATDRISKDLSNLKNEFKKLAIHIEDTDEFISHTLKELKKSLIKQQKSYLKYGNKKLNMFSKLKRNLFNNNLIELICQEAETFEALLFIVERKSETLRLDSFNLKKLSQSPKKNLLTGIALTFSPETGISDAISLYYYYQAISTFLTRKTSSIYLDFKKFRKTLK